MFKILFVLLISLVSASSFAGSDKEQSAREKAFMLKDMLSENHAYAISIIRNEDGTYHFSASDFDMNTNNIIYGPVIHVTAETDVLKYTTEDLRPKFEDMQMCNCSASWLE